MIRKTYLFSLSRTKQLNTQRLFFKQLNITIHNYLKKKKKWKRKKTSSLMTFENITWWRLLFYFKPTIVFFNSIILIIIWMLSPWLCLFLLASACKCNITFILFLTNCLVYSSTFKQKFVNIKEQYKTNNNSDSQKQQLCFDRICFIYWTINDNLSWVIMTLI